MKGVATINERIPRGHLAQYWARLVIYNEARILNGLGGLPTVLGAPYQIWKTACSDEKGVDLDHTIMGFSF